VTGFLLDTNILSELRRPKPEPKVLARLAETFARIPHAHGRELGRLGLCGAAWTLLIELDRLIFEARGKNPIKLTYRSREAAGLTRRTTSRGLGQLAKAGVNARRRIRWRELTRRGGSVAMLTRRNRGIRVRFRARASLRRRCDKPESQCVSPTSML
jgi:hypothetical protein